LGIDSEGAHTNVPDGMKSVLPTTDPLDETESFAA